MPLGSDEFIDGYLRGDSEAAEQVDRWIRGAAGPYYRQLAHEWSDLLQDVRLEVFTELKKRRFRAEASLKTYIWRLVSHSCLDRVRAARRWRFTPWNEESGARPFRTRGTPAVSLETADLLARVLARVGEECRRIWRLILAGDSYRRISRKLGVSEGALRVRALRCRRQAQAIRKELLGEDL